MAIVAYSGLPRSGKSYGVVENVIIPGLKAGRHIITNIPVKLGRLSDDFPKGKVTIFKNSDAESDPNFFNLETQPAGVIWIIDEAWRFWRSGDKANQMRHCEKEFFTEHGHCVGDDGRTNEIVLVTQDLNQLSAFVRSLVQETYRAVKLSAIGQDKRYRVDVHQGAATGQKPGKPMRQLYGTYKPEVYQYYQSHTRNKTDFAAGMEEKVDNRGNVLKHPLIKLGIPSALLAAGFGVWRVMDYFAIEEEPAVAASSVVSPVSRPARSEPVLSSEAVYPPRRDYQQEFEIEPGWLPVSKKWRIVGEVNGVFWIWGENGTRRIHSRNCARFVKTGEPFCVIESHLVTYYSYKEPEREEGMERERFEYTGLSDDGA